MVVARCGRAGGESSSGFGVCLLVGRSASDGDHQNQGHARRLLEYVAKEHFETGGKALGGHDTKYAAFLNAVLRSIKDKFRITVTATNWKMEPQSGV